jgi:CelD/BcsL family acetyltransferase involved in cellulose biosynthesis
MPYTPASWDAIVERYEDAEVYHSSAWLAFLTVSQGAEPVVAVVRERERPVGYFVGAIVRRYGIRILGSPLPGWGTQCMGFLLEPGADRRAAAEALIGFAFRDLGCLHVELADRSLTAEQMTGSRYRVETGRTFVVDLRPTEEAILQGMHKNAKRQIARAIRLGLRSEIASDEAFADEFHGYLRAAFARQGLVPTYDVDRVRTLIRHVLPSGQLLLLRILDPDGATIATAIALAGRRTAVLWGIGYDRENERFHPIELLWWETMRHCRARGSARFDLGGGGDYKSKYGGPETLALHFSCSRYGGLRYGRDAVRRLVDARMIIAGRRRKSAPSGADDDSHDTHPEDQTSRAGPTSA